MRYRTAIGLACSSLLAASAISTTSASGLVREANTTLRLPQTPATLGYALSNAFGTLKFTDPLVIRHPPGETNRLFIVEQIGRIIVLTNLAQPDRTVFLDLRNRLPSPVAPDERGLLGLTFHPGFATNRWFYVFYTPLASGAGGTRLYNRLSRFDVSPDDPNSALADSEQILINQEDDASNHNGGDLHFGPDGYLYVSLGDEGGANDDQNNSQRIDQDFFSAIMRLDVDKRPGSLDPNPHPALAPGGYTVPPDNPFIGATVFNGRAVDPARVRTEFYAVGLRNPWRMTFDPLTGLLYCADVGQDAWEEIDIIVKGGNYGWAYREGKHRGPKSSQAPPGFTSIDPIYEYAHGTSGSFTGLSITGGVVYRGDAFGQLYGAYLFADWFAGHIWAIRYDGKQAYGLERLAGEAGISAFGIDPRNGDVLIGSLNRDVIQRLVYSARPVGTPLPETLAETGAFTDLTTLQPEPGIIPYSINVPFWSDAAIKTRWFSIPSTNLTIGYAPEAAWSFPTSSVWIKHFDLELVAGDPASKRRLETRFLVRNPVGVYGITYRWDDTQTNAVLVPDAGLDETFEIRENGQSRTQVWHYPGRVECLVCHTPGGGLALGFNTPQLNRGFDHGAGLQNQIDALNRAGYFTTAVSNSHTLRALAPASDTAQSLETRVRSYLAANCAHCHTPGGTGLGYWDARIATPTSAAGLLHGHLRDPQGDSANRVIAPGSLSHSILLDRVTRTGAGRMPPLASSVLNQEGIDLLSAWILGEATNALSYAQWQTRFFPTAPPVEAAAEADPDGDAALNYLEYLVNTHPLDAADPWSIQAGVVGGRFQLRFLRVANRGFEVQYTTDLANPQAWRPLDTPSNRPYFSATTEPVIVEDALGAGTARYYRVRVYAP
jgi:glucose/arabinose dehydrogenase/mono/diheme cytochrome c family protein